MSLFGTSLNAVSATGPGSVLTFDLPRQIISMQTSVNSDRVSYQVNLEGSLDGINWNTLASAAYTENSNPVVPVLVVSNATPVLFARANLVSVSTLGPTPAVTAVISASL